MSDLVRSRAPLKRVTVLQGEVKTSANPRVEMTTVLGSCIAICLFDPVAELGGMNHFLLSTGGGTESQEKKYGMYAFECLLNEILKRGGCRFDLRAKVFGGASIGGSYRDLGPKNGAFALDILAAEGIECTAKDLGGTQARRLRFLPCTGEARLMQVQRFEEPTPKPVRDPKPVAAALEFF